MQERHERNTEMDIKILREVETERQGGTDTREKPTEVVRDKGGWSRIDQETGGTVLICCLP